MVKEVPDFFLSSKTSLSKDTYVYIHNYPFIPHIDIWLLIHSAGWTMGLLDECEFKVGMTERFHTIKLYEQMSSACGEPENLENIISR